MKQVIWPSIMATSQPELNAQLAKAKTISKTVHLDFVDGKFAPSKVLQFPFKLKQSLEYSAHLMIKAPHPFIKKHKKGIQLFIPHFEVFKDPSTHIKFCYKEKIVTAFAILPQTSFTKIKEYLKYTNFILVLTVKPGFYGSKFQIRQLKKIQTIKKHIETHKLNTKIIVDGSMNKEHIKLAKKAGADIFISGSYLMKADNQSKAMKELQAAIKKN